MLSLLWVYIIIFSYFCCLSPHGESGLKLFCSLVSAYLLPSLPAWGEWIEIAILIRLLYHYYSLSPHGESGLKFALSPLQLNPVYVSPRMGRVD